MFKPIILISLSLSNKIADLISTKEELGVKSNDQVSDNIILLVAAIVHELGFIGVVKRILISTTDNSNTPDSDSSLDIRNSCDNLDSRPPSNYI
jgi:hypothetical protein